MGAKQESRRGRSTLEGGHVMQEHNVGANTQKCTQIPKRFPKWFPSDRVIWSSDRTDREFGYGRSSSDGGRRDDSNSATDRSRGRDLVLVFVLVNTTFKSTYSLKKTTRLESKRSFRTHARRPGRADSESERHTTKHSFFTNGWLIGCYVS